MPLTRIKTKGLGNSVSRVNIVDTGTEGTKVAAGTTAQRGSTAGQIRFNSETGLAEYYTGTSFKTIDSPPTISSISPTTEDAGNANIVITGSNFQSGATVTFVGNDGTSYASPSVTVNSDTQITATTPSSGLSSANEPFDVKVTNTSGLSVSLNDALDAGSTPAWTTASGQIGGNIMEGDTVNTTVVATDPDSTAVTYSLVSGSLPSGLSLNSTTGAITGTAPDVSADTTSTFTLGATSGGDTTNRAFNIVITNNLLSGITEVYNSETQSGNITTHLTSHGNIYDETASSSNTNSIWEGTKVARLNDGGNCGNWGNITSNFNTSGGLTVCVWAKAVTDNNNQQRIFDIYNRPCDFYQQFGGSNRQYTVSYRSGGSVDIRSLTGNSSWTHSNWHFHCYRWSVGMSESSQVIKFTVDDYDSKILYTNTPSAAAHGTSIMEAGFMGYDPAGSTGVNSYSFEGNTGGWRVFNAELTDAQVAFVYNSGKGRF